MAGIKGRSGRKSKAEEAGVAELIDSAVTAEDWRVIFRKLRDKAKRGDILATRLLAEYRFGKPHQSVELTGRGGGPVEHTVFSYESAVTPIAPGPTDDSETPGKDQVGGDGPPMG